MASSQQSIPSLLPLLSVPQLSAITGLAAGTIYNRHCTGGDLPPATKLGRRLTFPQQGVHEWLAAHTQAPTVPEAPPPPVQKRRRGRPTIAETMAREKIQGRSI